jgi:hypothetical protein
MKKATPKATAPPDTMEEEQALTPIIPIRTETTLTRYPFHRIAKRGKVKIKETKRNKQGKVESVWEVRNPPGPLAYKLDTLIVNRRFDEVRPDIPMLLKLGSLADICREMGINPSGKNTNAIKEALRENAFAGITCKLEFVGNDGTQRHFEFNTTRYTVIFSGQKLPNEKIADGVYIELHPRFHEMLKHSKTRPLNYEYLRELPPSAQRLYELLSFAIYGALKHDRPNAQLLYSEFCQSAPLTRYFVWMQAKKQLYKIHKPHIDAGYIKSIEFEETIDASGAVDWLMKYTPGRKARHEFKEFSKKGIESSLKKPRLVETAGSGSGIQSEPRNPVGQDVDALVKMLEAAGFNDETAQMLAVNYSEAALRELRAWPDRDKSGMKNPLGWLRKAIEKGDFSSPPKMKAKQAPQGKGREVDAKKSLEDRYNELYLREYLRPFAASLSTVNAEAFNAYQERCDRIDRYGNDLPEEARAFFKLWELADMSQYWPEIGLLKLHEWLRKEHPEAFIE